MWPIAEDHSQGGACHQEIQDGEGRQQGLLDCLQEDVVDIKVIKDTDRKFDRAMASALQRR